MEQLSKKLQEPWIKKLEDFKNKKNTFSNINPTNNICK